MSGVPHMPAISCVWMSTASAAAISTVSQGIFDAAFNQAGTTYMRVCEGSNLINVTLGNAISAANGGDPLD